MNNAYNALATVFYAGVLWLLVFAAGALPVGRHVLCGRTLFLRKQPQFNWTVGLADLAALCVLLCAALALAGSIAALDSEHPSVIGVGAGVITLWSAVLFWLRGLWILRRAGIRQSAARFWVIVLWHPAAVLGSLGCFVAFTLFVGSVGRLFVEQPPERILGELVRGGWLSPELAMLGAGCLSGVAMFLSRGAFARIVANEMRQSATNAPPEPPHPLDRGPQIVP